MSGEVVEGVNVQITFEPAEEMYNVQVNNIVVSSKDLVTAITEAQRLLSFVVTATAVGFVSKYPQLFFSTSTPEQIPAEPAEGEPSV